MVPRISVIVLFFCICCELDKIDIMCDVWLVYYWQAQAQLHVLPMEPPALCDMMFVLLDCMAYELLGCTALFAD